MRKLANPAKQGPFCRDRVMVVGLRGVCALTVGALMIEGVGAFLLSTAAKHGAGLRAAASQRRGMYMAALPSAHEVAAFTSSRQKILSTYAAVRLCARHETASDDVTIDLLGDTLLVQTWREPITAHDASACALRLADDISAALGAPMPLKLFFSHRGRGIQTKTKGRDRTYDSLKADLEQACRWGGGINATMTEGNLKFLTLLSAARDPGLHLVRLADRPTANSNRIPHIETLTYLHTYSCACLCA